MLPESQAQLRWQAGNYGARHWRQDNRHHDSHLHGSRYIRRHRRPQQRRKRRVPHAFFHSTRVCGGRFVCRELLRFTRHGNLVGHHYAHHAHFRCRVRRLRLRFAALRGVGHGWRDVWRQPVVHLGHDNRGVPRSRMRHERQVPRELQDRTARRVGIARNYFSAVVQREHHRRGDS